MATTAPAASGMMGRVEAYRLIDAGDGARLERFGAHVTDRPHAGSLGPRRAPERWSEADLRFDRERGWSSRDASPVELWVVEVAGLTMGLRPTEAGQVGLFPEHLETIDWLTARVAARVGAGHVPQVLHLFAYTGLVTLALARAGAAVAHVDASRPTVAWARENAERNALADRPIRWLVDDARDFTTREVRRGRRYDGIVLDPPTYGHGGKGGRRWEIGVDLPPLLELGGRLLADDGFMLLTAHAEGLGPDDLAWAMRDAWGVTGPDLGIQSGDLALEADAGGRLLLGAYARWDRSA